MGMYKLKAWFLYAMIERMMKDMNNDYLLKLFLGMVDTNSSEGLRKII